MANRLLIAAALASMSVPAFANPVAMGTIAQVSVGTDDVAVYINATTGSPCASGWFYSFSSDTDDMTLNRLYATMLAAWISGSSITLYDTTAVCNQGTGARFTSATSG